MKKKKILIYGLLGSLYISLVCLLIAFIGGAIIFYKFSQGLPDIRELKNYKPSLTTRVYSDADELIEEFFIERRILVSLSDIPAILKKAAIAVEDSRFYKHHGIDITGIMRAFIKNVRAGGVVEGGSTITQQVAKTMFLSPERKIQRKIKEVILAIRIEKFFTKNEILEIYLNQIYYGHGAYGVEAAARTYFGKHVQDINIPEAAFIAGLPRAPVRYSPYKNLEKAWKRRAYALNRMEREGFISVSSAEKAANSEFKLADRFGKSKNEGEYFVEYIRRYIQKKYGSANLYRNGLNIYTTLNIRDQKFARQAVLAGLRKADKRFGYRGAIGKTEVNSDGTVNLIESSLMNLQDKEKSEGDIFKTGNALKGVVTYINEKSVDVNIGGRKGAIALKDMSWAREPNVQIDGRYARIRKPEKALNVGDIIEVKVLEPDRTSIEKGLLKLALEQEPLVQGALVSIDVATGHIKSMVGGRNFSESEFNRATQAIRQPGSAFKPIIYAAALENGFTPASIVIDSPIIYSSDREIKSLWKPFNFEQKFYGPTTLRNAITHSRNIVTIKLLKSIGVKKAVEYVRRLGIKSQINEDLSLALGSSGISLMDITSTYSIFARGGIKIEPSAIRYITDRNGDMLEKNEPVSERVMSEEAAYVITNLLKNVINQGTGRKVKSIGRPVAGKTGTTNKYVDTWFLGYTPDRVTGVWVGLDEDTSLGKNETGSRTSSPIWLEYMKNSLEGTPITDFKTPPNVVFARIDPKSGLLSPAGEKNYILESFFDGTVPVNYTEKEKGKREDFFSEDLAVIN